MTNMNRDAAVLAAGLTSAGLGTLAIVTVLAGLWHWSLICAIGAVATLGVVQVLLLHARVDRHDRQLAATHLAWRYQNPDGLDDTADELAVAIAVGLDTDHVRRLLDDPDQPLLRDLERRYVEALNAVLSVPGERESDDDLNRWRGQAEAYRQVCERIRRDEKLPTVRYASGEWRAANGVREPSQLAR